MNIALSQLNFTIGAFEDNVGKIIASINSAKKKGADLIIFSELAVCGYPPLDLLEHQYFIKKCQEAIELILPHTKDAGVIVGTPTVNTGPKGKNLFNSALFIEDGSIKQTVNKTLLPTYDIFDEYRYFEPATDHTLIKFRDKRIALTICEDLWYKQPILTSFGKDKLYRTNPIEELIKFKPDFIINIAASPFAYNHDEIKSDILRNNATRYKLPIIYVNQVGAQTELIFDGASRCLNSDGENILLLKSFEEDLQIISVNDILSKKKGLAQKLPGLRIANIHDALILGIRDYFQKMGFSKAVLGLSGGIDSAVTLVLAVKALGSKNVMVLLMPSKYSSDHSVTDAIELADNLNVKYNIVPIRQIVDSFENELKDIFSGLAPDITEENLQARIRGTLLMAISNKFGNILLNTSNKSEAAVGYGTLYGDMNGGLSILGDVYKTDVYKLAQYINSGKIVIPENTLTKPPSAELRPDQKDTDSLPDYNVLDAILFRYIELRKSANELILEGFEEETVNRTISMVNSNEYKRFQTPPILRVSSKAFGLGRRMPLVARY